MGKWVDGWEDQPAGGDGWMGGISQMGGGGDQQMGRWMDRWD